MLPLSLAPSKRAAPGITTSAGSGPVCATTLGQDFLTRLRALLHVTSGSSAWAIVSSASTVFRPGEVDLVVVLVDAQRDHARGRLSESASFRR